MAPTRKPRQRDYRAEYARRKQRAKAQGFTGYGAKRGALTRSKQIPNQILQQRFLIYAATHNVREQQKWIRGANALLRQDHATADQMATELKLQPATTDLMYEGREYPPDSAFWYH